jgi:uncharacterized membrane protein YkvA (DUF1232 family)
MAATINSPKFTVTDAHRRTWWVKHTARSREGVAFVLRQARVLTLLMKHRRSPWTSRVIAVCTVSYLLSPIQLIPTFLPVIGQLDDLFVLFLGLKLIRKLTPKEILTECEHRAASSVFRRHSSTHSEERAEPGSVVVV